MKKKKKYILTEEQKKEHWGNIVWLIISIILGTVLSYFYLLNSGEKGIDHIVISWVLFSGGILALHHFTVLLSISLFSSSVLFITTKNVLAKFAIVIITYMIIVIPSVLIGWVFLILDIIMLIMKRPLVYKTIKLNYEYIEQEEPNQNK